MQPKNNWILSHNDSKVDLPDDLIMEIVKAKDNETVNQIGVEWCINQSKELIKSGIPVLHYYSMGKSDNIRKIAKRFLINSMLI